MADLGIYNYIRAARERGETDEQIRAALTKSGLNEQEIGGAFDAVKSGKPPIIRDRQPAPRKTTAWRGFLWSVLFVFLIACVIGGYLLLTYRMSLPWKQSACADADQCVSNDVQQIAAEAQQLYSYSGNSYASLCDGGEVNFEAASGTDEAALGINADLRNYVNDIIQKRDASSQEDAGISCGSRSDRFFVSASLRDASTSKGADDYCVDSRGVSTTSPPDLGIVFCGSELSSF